MNIENKIIEIFNEWEIDLPDDCLDFDLFENEIIDSFMMSSLILELEGRFNITFDIDEMEFNNFSTIARIKSLIEKKQRG